MLDLGHADHDGITGVDIRHARFWTEDVDVDSGVIPFGRRIEESQHALVV